MTYDIYDNQESGEAVLLRENLTEQEATEQAAPKRKVESQSNGIGPVMANTAI